MQAVELLNQYLNSSYTFQIATIEAGQPWICTVYFVSDEQHNIYWFSLPSRRHSKEIENHPKVAGAVVVKNIIGESVIGIQIEGKAAKQNISQKNKTIVEKYAAKFKRDQNWVKDCFAGRIEHRLYKLTPSTIYLFDEENFPGGQRQKVL